MTFRISNWTDATDAEREALLQRPAPQASGNLSAGVRDIIDEVRSGGDKSLFAYAQQLDGVEIENLQVTNEEISMARQHLSASQRSALELAISNVRQFHEAQLPARISIETMPGVRCERTSHAIESVGLYVPAGTAPLPSAAIMLAVPAAIAGCTTKVLCTPPRPDGHADSAVLVAAELAGADTVFKIGGAQAIAAMAYGTETVPKVAKIFGPGNAWVTEAKTQVASDPTGAAIDMPAGPSEVLIIADEHANAEFVAADLLSQAEHGADSQVLLLTVSHRFAATVVRQIEIQLDALDRAEVARRSLSSSHVIVVEDLAAAVEISNRYAPEHLIVQTSNARELLGGIRNAGSVFVGPWSPESVGDYASGTNHVLPTYGYARSVSGLGVEQFMRHMTIQELTPAGLRNIGDAVIELAELEGLQAHAAAVARRMATLEPE